ncbi:hypothetical protein GCM10017774_20330 [Lentzea cavernae]|uniref:Uncharacterized protein n=1 Tax=Lentzea cavernae TaxID=2020703 RepID=A0ABQ3M834_9PSEU|nr:hypothetical protein GCM10017774_20330 [Lentzea cavernae]
MLWIRISRKRAARPQVTGPPAIDGADRSVTGRGVVRGVRSYGAAVWVTLIRMDAPKDLLKVGAPGVAAKCR